MFSLAHTLAIISDFHRAMRPQERATMILIIEVMNALPAAGGVMFHPISPYCEQG